MLTMFSLEKGAGAATVLPVKGGEGYQSSWACRALQWMGHYELLPQCDQEPSIRAVTDRIVGRRRSRTSIREVPRGSHQRMAGYEWWNQSIQEEFRALRGQLERDIGLEIKADMPVCAWIVRHAAWTNVRYQPQCAQGGLSVYARICGQPYRGKVFRFGERVMVYDESDEILLEESKRSAAWKKRSERTDLVCRFVAVPHEGHFYKAYLDC